MSPALLSPLSLNAQAPPQRVYAAPQVDQFRHSIEKEGFFQRCINRIRMFFRTLGIGVVAVVMATSGLIVYCLPLMPEFSRRWWRQSLVAVLGYCGACTTKLGQWAATRPDLFPESICKALGDLHTRAPTHALRHTKKAIHRAYQKEIEEVFEAFDEVPIASGSIAQVYKAIYRDPQTQQNVDVIVKVRHPHVVDNMNIDLRILRAVGRVVEYLPGFKWMSVRQNIECFAMQMEQQLSMINEGRNLVQFRQNFKQFPNICFPRPFVTLSNEEILVETFEAGTQVSEYFTANASGISTSPKFRKQLATLGFNAFLKMLFVDNFIHGDLHPGNVLIRERHGESEKPQIVFLDAGLVVRLTEKDRSNFIDLFAAVAAGNGRKGARLMIERSEDRIPTVELQEKFKREMSDLFEEVTAMPLGKIPIGREFFRVMHLCRKCQVRIDGSFCSLIAGLVVVEGVARALNADFDLLNESRPLLAKDKDFVMSYLRNRL